MSNSELRTFSDYNLDTKNYRQGNTVKITKGSFKGCQGRILGCNNEWSNGIASPRVYFVGIDSCQRTTDPTYTPIDLFLPDEFELVD